MSAPDIWEELVACRRRGEAAALATIISTQGSTPGKDPMKMLVRGDGTFVGSVGGGCLEAEVWEHARTVMRTLRPMSVSFSLTEEDYPDSGLICGGKLTVFIEPVTLPVVHVFGAGHVGAETARLAHGAGFRVRLYDDREDMLAAESVPEAVERVAGPFEQTASQALRGDVNLVIVVTRGHHDDERVLRCLLAGHTAPRFLGMIGSRAKRHQIVERLAAEGIPEDVLERVVSPVGLPIGARTAPEIALSIVAQLVSECRGGGMGGEADRTRARGGGEEAGDEGMRGAHRSATELP
ncbi:MAG: XdhC family protein [Planctomycetota bacterium]|jgi:xanthine dehydrogenase accessory factor